ncbi:MAG: hypothetical protein GY748_24355 [Planctomycetaceae bacterium]|nr:hypothetical protein [Planctomycetaceae bacterium]
MTFSSLNLGYNVRRAKLDECGGLTVFSHDLDCFCIPVSHADRLASAYKRYLAGAEILDWYKDFSCNEQQVECDRYSIGFFHDRDKTEFVPGEFSLAAAIEFVWLEAGVSDELALRWCMMMEYIIWQDNRLSEKSELAQRDPESHEPGNDELEEDCAA